jgi:hypothetical protein
MAAAYNVADLVPFRTVGMASQKVSFQRLIVQNQGNSQFAKVSQSVAPAQQQQSAAPAQQQSVQQHAVQAAVQQMHQPAQLHLDGVESMGITQDGKLIQSPNPAVSATAFTTNQFSPSGILTCPQPAALTTQCMSGADYDFITQQVQNIHQGFTAGTDQADFAGCIVRMTGHDLMDFRRGAPAGENGGADGCIDFQDGDNAGLQSCLQLLQPAYDAAFPSNGLLTCQKVSLADFLVVAAEAIMEITRATTAPIGFKDNFRFGRTTSQTCSWAHGRLPNPENGCRDAPLPNGGESVKTSFVDSLELSWPQAATLMGTHTLGRAASVNSGYDGWWSDPTNQGVFNNDYYKSLIGKGWEKVTTSVGSAGAVKTQWNWIGKDSQTFGGTPVMMLTSDMCLWNDMVSAESAPDGCCLWNFQQGLGASGGAVSTPHCGGPAGLPFGTDHTNCCGNQPSGPCNSDAITPVGPENLFGSTDQANQLPSHLRQLAHDTTGLDSFYTDFKLVWTKVVENGFESQLQTPQAAECTPTDPTDPPTKAPTVAVADPTSPPTLSPSKPPTLSPTIPTPPEEPTCWTPWMNRDTPTGTGEWETLEALAAEHPAAFIDAGCTFDQYSSTVSTPQGVECKEAYTGTPFEAMHDTFTNGIACTPEEGLVCLNADQSYGTCNNYKIRFNCCQSADEAHGNPTTLTFQGSEKKECEIVMRNGKLVSTCPISSPLDSRSDTTFMRQDIEAIHTRLAAIEHRMGMDTM